jgi:hypothetical protein
LIVTSLEGCSQERQNLWQLKLEDGALSIQRQCMDSFVGAKSVNVATDLGVDKPGVEFTPIGWSQD